MSPYFLRLRTTYRYESLLSLIAFLTAGIVFLAMKARATSLLFPISTPYFTIATNLFLHGSYSMSLTAPFVPHSGYTPLLPLLLAPLVAVPYVIFPLFWLISAAVAVLLYRLMVRLGISTRAAFVGALISLLEPYRMFFANQVYTELLVTLFLLGFLLLFLSYLRRGDGKTQVVMALLLGLATLTRPVCQFLVVLLPFAALIRLRVAGWRTAALHVIVGCAVFVAVLFPWLARNKVVFGSWALSSLQTRQFLSAGLPHFLEWKEHGTHPTEAGIFRYTTELTDRAMALSGASNNDFDIRQSGVVTRGVILPIIRENFSSMTIFWFSQLPFSLLTDNWRMAAEAVLGTAPKNKTPLSAALAAAAGDPTQLLAAFDSFDIYTVTFLLGKLFWLAAYLLAGIGCIVAWKQRSFPRIFLALLVALIFFFPFVSLPYLEARYRLPGTPGVYVLATIGAIACQHALGRLFARMRKMPRSAAPS